MLNIPDAMAPTDKNIPAPFRWAFAPLESPLDKSILWSWRAYDFAGNLVMESDGTFESRQDCVEDAVARGYRPPS